MAFSAANPTTTRAHAGVVKLLSIPFSFSLLACFKDKVLGRGCALNYNTFWGQSPPEKENQPDEERRYDPNRWQKVRDYVVHNNLLFEKAADELAREVIPPGPGPGPGSRFEGSAFDKLVSDAGELLRPDREGQLMMPSMFSRLIAKLMVEKIGITDTDTESDVEDRCPRICGQAYPERVENQMKPLTHLYAHSAVASGVEVDVVALLKLSPQERARAHQMELHLGERPLSPRDLFNRLVALDFPLPQIGDADWSENRNKFVIPFQDACRQALMLRLQTVEIYRLWEYQVKEQSTETLTTPTIEGPRTSSSPDRGQYEQEYERLQTAARAFSLDPRYGGNIQTIISASSSEAAINSPSLASASTASDGTLRTAFLNALAPFALRILKALTVRGASAAPSAGSHGEATEATRETTPGGFRDAPLWGVGVLRG
eukprot:g1805.t1